METNVTLRTCRTCHKTKYATTKTFKITRIAGKAYWSKDCIECTKKRSTSKFKRYTGKLKMRHRTIHEEKVKAYLRDKQCVAPWCHEHIFERLDFDHAYSASKDKLTDEYDPNRHEFATMNCRKDHDLTKEDKDFYYYKHILLWKIHGLIKPNIPDELIEAIWQKFRGMTEYVREPQLYLQYKGKVSSNAENNE